MVYGTVTKQSLYLDWSIWHDYNWSTVQRVVPAKAGVYALAVKLVNGNLNVFYVGQTDDLDRRLKEHLSASEPNWCIKENLKYMCLFRYCLVASSSDRDKVERALYFNFFPRPSCNDFSAIPAVSDIEINF